MVHPRKVIEFLALFLGKERRSFGSKVAALAGAPL
jgi:hypothetical protein